MRRLLLLAFCLFAGRVFAQQEVSVDVLITDELQGRNEVSFATPKLTWDDFKGRPEKNAPWTAMTYSGIKLRYEYKHKDGHGHVVIKLYPYMDQSHSWYVDAGHNNYTLAHEQRHFDITILIANQLAEALTQIDYSPKKFSSQINKVHDLYLQKLRDMQDQYDEETEHGIKVYVQRAWDKKILQQLAAFAVND